MILSITWLHFHVILRGASLGIDNKKAASYIYDVLSQHPKLTLLIGGPLLVILVLYACLFFAIAWIAREPSSKLRLRQLFVLLCSWASVWWLLLASQVWLFPHSTWADLSGPIMRQTASPLITVIAAIYILIRLKQRLSNSGTSSIRVIAFLASAAILAAGYHAYDFQPKNSQSAAKDAGNKPNVILIGLDSLRRDALLSANEQYLPNLARLRDLSFVEANVITPLARTFPAWVSILTGLSPAEHGARDNLAPQELVRRDASIGWWLKDRGYRTVYATDDSRFSNIGKEFGFDKIVSPMPGVPDFVLAQFADLPLVNLAIMLPYSEYLFPSLVGNRAFSHAYHPRRFVKRLETALGDAGNLPQFLAIHLCTVHWPFYTAESDLSNNEEEPYVRSTRELDRQLEDLLEMLRRRGYLTASTLLVVLADHGEGLSRVQPESRPPSRIGSPQVLGNQIMGHGGTLIIPAEWQVFALFSGQSAIGAIPRGASDGLAALQDVSPTLKSLLGEKAMAQRMSVVDAISNQSVSRASRSVVAIETGFSPRGFDLANPDGNTALSIAINSFTISDNGHVSMKQDAYNVAIADKNYGVTDGQAVLASVKTSDDRLLVGVDKLGNRIFYPQQPPSSIDEMPPALLKEGCANMAFAKHFSNWCNSVK